VLLASSDVVKSKAVATYRLQIPKKWIFVVFFICSSCFLHKDIGANRIGAEFFYRR